MARISRVRGPNGNFTVPENFAEITGFRIERQFGSGTLLITGHCQIESTGGLIARPALAVAFDDTRIVQNGIRGFVAIGERSVVSFSHLITVTRGLHAVSLQIHWIAAAGGSVTSGRCELCVVELPEWDDDVNLVVL